MSIENWPHRVPFNIWDDYWGDGCCPKGEIQETVGYVEDDLSERQKEEVCHIIFENLKKLDMPGVKFEIESGTICFTHLTHERLEKLIEELQALGLKYKSVPIDFYSES
jgi:hypothetical protein